MIRELVEPGEPGAYQSYNKRGAQTNQFSATKEKEKGDPVFSTIGLEGSAISYVIASFLDTALAFASSRPGG